MERARSFVSGYMRTHDHVRGRAIPADPYWPSRSVPPFPPAVPCVRNYADRKAENEKRAEKKAGHHNDTLYKPNTLLVSVRVYLAGCSGWRYGS